MFCTRCGKEISDDAVVCSHYGNATGKPAVPSAGADVKISFIGVIGSFLFPLIGLIVGIVYCRDSNPSKKRAGGAYCAAAVISIAVSYFVRQPMI